MSLFFPLDFFKMIILKISMHTWFNIEQFLRIEIWLLLREILSETVVVNVADRGTMHRVECFTCNLEKRLHILYQYHTLFAALFPECTARAMSPIHLSLIPAPANSHVINPDIACFSNENHHLVFTKVFCV